MNEIHCYERRHKLLAQMEEGVAIIASAPIQTRSNDTEYPYRQNSDFYYLCGFNEDNSILVLVKTLDSTKMLLFVEAYNAEHTLWNGARLGVDGARERFRVDEVHDVAEYGGMIKEILREHVNLYIDLFETSEILSQAKAAAQSLRETRGVKRHIRSIHDVTHLIRKMRLIKSSKEVEAIKKAIALTMEAHHKAMRECNSGMREYQLQAIMNYVFINGGASAEAYSAIVAGGNNANTLHYIDNSDELRNGELVLIDAACEWKLYASDITRTFPINGKFTDPQREVYNAVLDVQLRVIEAIKPGVKRDWLQTYSEELLCDALIRLGVLSGDRKTLMEAKEHKKYAPHGIGHWMGLDVHDPCPYVDEWGESLAFEAGMVMTIEPGLYFRADDESVPEAFRGIGIRIEDDILVTSEGYENLSSMIAKSVEEIEVMCKR
ncbi:aminopeptidase P N-terminal domain-containing protein [Sulfuricurvum sp.]|uniref:aminopeptidase P N-terminal domain-containing protein n=1 Tax=Sulfuricurvum sp. TaxID=2025608 RepID=UPI0019CD99FC|nr:aminopeptidase P N-terminal domain-containing protein [Sulfuricurvum sp.]MBD3798860.1 aminopeptidase P N-terminal domain-containing protein [Campylobacterota bacterium]MBD3805893.1 aminopeptidase P N-terminal domain-containing protein [Sulfuricurvum sp.]